MDLIVFRPCFVQDEIFGPVLLCMEVCLLIPFVFLCNSSFSLPGMGVNKFDFFLMSGGQLRRGNKHC